MTKLEELSYVADLAAKLGPDSYLGQWIADCLPMLRDLLASDLIPESPVKMYHDAAAYRQEALNDAKQTRDMAIQELEKAREKARQESARIIQSAEQHAATIRKRIQDAVSDLM